MRGRSGSIAITDAHVLTNDPERPTARAVVIHDGVITYVGSDEGARTEDRGVDRRIDARGATLIPGFNDAHGHFIHHGLMQDRIDLVGCASVDEVYARIRAHAAAHPDKDVLIAERWDQSDWSDPAALPHRERLDEAGGGRPVLCRRVCGHIAYASTALLEMYDERWEGSWDGIDRSTGLLAEDPAMRFGDVAPVTPADMERAIRFFMREAPREGVTSAQDFADMRGWRAWQTHRRAQDRGGHDIDCRMDVALYIEHSDALLAAGVSTGLGDDWLRLGGVKAFADGSFGGWTAHLHEPYADRADTTGHATYDDETLLRFVERTHRGGLQQRLHVIGDAAVEQGTRVFERVAEGVGREEFHAMRHRFEHYEMSNEVQRARALRLGVVLSMQPNFVGAWSRPDGLYGRRLGERHTHTNPFRILHREGHPMAFGSDVMPFGPMEGLRAVVQAPYPHMSLDLLTALRLYTHGSAYAQHRENVKGTLREGLLGDCVLLSEDLGAHDLDDPRAMDGLHVTRTVLDGRPTYEGV